MTLSVKEMHMVRVQVFQNSKQQFDNVGKVQFASMDLKTVAAFESVLNQLITLMHDYGELIYDDGENLKSFLRDVDAKDAASSGGA